mmetsp:Transcript_9215/g.24496  ORF Transcript_9215/g.24496 Transcript_9215/m.24496 type:complete len:208 (-) Transcript_9215:204-827(-)
MSRQVSQQSARQHSDAALTLRSGSPCLELERLFALRPCRLRLPFLQGERCGLLGSLPQGGEQLARDGLVAGAAGRQAMLRQLHDFFAVHGSRQLHLRRERLFLNPFLQGLVVPMFRLPGVSDSWSLHLLLLERLFLVAGEVSSCAKGANAVLRVGAGRRHAGQQRRCRGGIRQRVFENTGEHALTEGWHLPRVLHGPRAQALAQRCQ